MERGMRIATRGSKLALAQADIISSLLRDNGILAEKITVKSQGDVDVRSPIYESKEQGVFVRKLNEKVIDGYADAAVHSAKDIPYEIDPDLEVSFFSKRGDPRDFFVGKKSISQFSGTVGSSSIRRMMFLRLYNNKLIFENIRGNVETRIRKWSDGEVGALVLAKVALDRLMLTPEGEVIPESVCPPDPNQGFIAVVTRKNSSEGMLFRKMQDPEALWEASTERELVGELQLGCSRAVSIRAAFPTKTISFSYANEEKRYDLHFKQSVDRSALNRIREIIDG